MIEKQIEAESKAEIEQRDFNSKMEWPICSECGHQYNPSYEQEVTADGETYKICNKSECYGNLMARRVQENMRY